MTETGVSTKSLQDAIHARVASLGTTVKEMRPAAMVAVLGGAALWPVVAPLLGAGAAVGVVGGVMGLLGGPGKGFISDFLERLADRGEGEPGAVSEAVVRAELERELLERLEAPDGEAASLRADVSRLLQSVGGVEVALAAAAADVRETLARGLAEVGGSWSEFRWVLGEVRELLVEIRVRQAEGLALEREQLDLLREQLTKTNLLLRIQEDAPLASLDAMAERGETFAATLCPYKGLEAFQPEDAAYFSGREELVAGLVARLAESRFLAVVGASGSGKSSLVRAGLVPALWNGALPGSKEWVVRILTPGEHPLEELAMRLSLLRGIASGSLLDDLWADPRRLELAIRQVLLGESERVRLVLLVDQFEELFTLCRDERERGRFIEALVHAHASGPARAVVVVTVRADFYGRLADYPSFAAASQQNQVLVGPMTQEELRRAIERPGVQAGLSLEPGLIEAIMKDVSGAPGSLPLLSHALLETWERRRGRVLTLAGYRDAGGVERAVATRAEAAFEAFDLDGQQIARRIFLRLTQPGDGTEDTRRRAALAEFATDGEEVGAVEAVLRPLVEARLVTAGADEAGERWIDVAHESLVHAWPRMRRWVDENREGLIVHRRLSEAAEEWERREHDADVLYRGARLSDALEWQRGDEDATNPLERDFLETSRRQQEHERRARRRRIQGALAGLATALAAIGAVAVVALLQRQDALRQSKIAASRELAVRATAQLQIDPSISLLLALRAMGKRQTSEAEDALKTALGDSPLRSLIRGRFRAIAFSADGKFVVGVGQNARGTRIFDAATGEEVPIARARDYSAAFSPDGDFVLVAADGAAAVWATATGKQRATLGADPSSLSFSPDGTFIVASTANSRASKWRIAELVKRAGAPEGRRPDFGFTWKSAGSSVVVDASAKITLRSTATGATVHVPGSWRIPTFRPAFSRNGGLVLIGDDLIGARIVDVITGRTRVLRNAPASDSIVSASISPDNRFAALGEQSGAAGIWNIVTGKQIVRVQGARESPCTTAEFSPDSALFLTASRGSIVAEVSDHTVRVWEAATGKQVGELKGHTGAVDTARFSPNGRFVLTHSGNDTPAGDGAVRVWEVGLRILRQPGRSGLHVLSTSFAPDGGLVAAAGLDGIVRVWNVERGVPVAVFTGHRDGVSAVEFRRDGRHLVSAGRDGTVRLWDVSTGRRQTLVNADHPIYRAAFSKGGEFVGTIVRGRLVVWDLGKGKRVPSPRYNVYGVAFGGRGSLLATTGDYATRVLSTTGRLHWSLYVQHTTALLTGDRLAVLTNDGGVLFRAYAEDAEIWSVKRRERLSTLAGAGAVSAAAFSDDGKYLVTASADSLRVWYVASGKPVGVLRGENTTTSVAFSPDNKRVLTGDANGAVLIYPCEGCGSLDELLGLAKQRVANTFTPEDRRRLSQ